MESSNNFNCLDKVFSSLLLREMTFSTFLSNERAKIYDIDNIN